ncbi:MAG: hypothetical protein ACXITV_05310 [Luteibaculaceae bacterium]
MIGFTTKPLTKANFLQKLLGSKSAANFAIEVENLLYEAKTPSAIDQQKLDEVFAKYNMRAGSKKVKGLLKHLYVQFVRYCLQNYSLSAEEKEELHFLKLLLHLNDKEAQALLEETAIETFKLKLGEKIDSKTLTPEAFDMLEQMKKEVGLNEEDARKIAVEFGSKKLQEAASEVVSNKRVSPEEEAFLKRLSESMRIDISMDKENQEYFDYLKRLWQIENGELPTVNTTFRLQRGEVCYFNSYGTKWFEYRRITKRLNYAGPTARIKLAKGIYYRAGSLGVKPTTSDELTLIDQGAFLVTNKRVIFVGELGNKQILFKSILQINTYNNGIDIQKSTGRSPFVEIPGLHASEMASIILNRVLDEFY